MSPGVAGAAGGGRVPRSGAALGRGPHELVPVQNNEFSSRAFERVCAPNRAVSSARHALRSSQAWAFATPDTQGDGVQEASSRQQHASSSGEPRSLRGGLLPAEQASAPRQQQAQAQKWGAPEEEAMGPRTVPVALGRAPGCSPGAEWAEGVGPGRGRGLGGAGPGRGFSTTESCLRAELGLPAHCGLDQGGSESSAPPPQTPVPGARSSQTTGASVTAGPGFALSLPGSDRAQGGRVSTWTALSSPRSSEDHHAAPRRGTSHHALAPAPGGRLGLHRSRVVRPSRRQSRRRRPPPHV